MAKARTQPRFGYRLVNRALQGWLEFRLVEPERPDIDHELPTIYVMPRAALSDEAAVAQLTERLGLPSASNPVMIGDTALPGCIALPRSRRLGQTRATRCFEPLLEALSRHPELDVQLVPVSVFWSRAPAKEFGFWKMLAADDWAWSGRLRRLLSVVVNGRQLEAHWGQPIRLRALVDDTPAALLPRKIARVLRVHFRRIRTRVLGPDLSHRRTLVRGVVSSRAVQRTLQETAQANATSLEQERRRAERYAREIASNMSYPVLRFCYQLLKRLWNRLYDGVDVHGLEAVKAIAGDKTLVYVPCHRSHIDYLLLSYVLYREGLMPPHVAAGRNLDMPLIGPLLRRGGAFFLRRSFKENRLYASVFNEYLHRLVEGGHPVEYFIEGGRSRTGRMMSPRPGMLAMTLRSYLRDPVRDVAFVPIHIGYEKVLESNAYLRELRGEAKKKESPLALLHALRHLRKPHGRVTVSVGEPLSLRAFLDAHAPGWEAQRQQHRPPWLNDVVPTLGETLAQRINAAASLNAVSLVAMALLATPHHTIECDLLSEHIELLVRLQQAVPASDRLTLPIGEPNAWITHAIELGFVTRQPQALGELITASPEQATLLTWYRNGALHLFTHFGLVAFAFRNNAVFTLETLEPTLTPAWPLLARELHFPPPECPADSLRRTLAALTAAELLESHDGEWHRQPGHWQSSEHLRLLGQLVQPTLERAYLLVAILLRHPNGTLTRDSLEAHGRHLAERLTLLAGLDAPEFFDKRLFSDILDTLMSRGWLTIEHECLHYAEALPRAQARSRALFDPELRHRIVRLAER
ncbi:glycerol-3-phosphate 1-O-acyltransferase PlsB [Salinicola halophilus]|uniref:glycerol-3-phosphate 1-O-acyltransferase PlsB n=1 Tax=Salinicola halophilus TaxID=184065 RepID=UPI0019550811|nr:glycerol-3-phosphate 1-O-acyltransferase PlsB [Salinicola halophilus]